MPDHDATGTPHDPPGSYDTPSPHASNAEYALRAREYATKGQAGFLKGNPGRLPESKNKRSKSAQELMDALGFDPLALKVKLVQQLGEKISRGQWRTDYEELETQKLYSEALKDILQYRHQRLKSVESHTQIELVQKLQSLEGRSDEELRELLAQAQELAQLPPGKSG